MKYLLGFAFIASLFIFDIDNVVDAINMKQKVNEELKTNPDSGPNLIKRMKTTLAQIEKTSDKRMHKYKVVR